MFTNDQALAACREIRPLLPELIPAAADQIDGQLAQILNQSGLDENIQVDRLVEILDAHTETKDWFDQFLQNSDCDKERKKFSGLPGDSPLADAISYVCPIGNDYTWYREANEEIPLCPTHLVPLVPAQE